MNFRKALRRKNRNSEMLERVGGGRAAIQKCWRGLEEEEQEFRNAVEDWRRKSRNSEML